MDRLFSVLLITCWACSAAAGTAILRRDTWGVPHVEAQTLSEAAFAVGYAQAEDRLEDIHKNVRTAIGAMAEAFGPQYATPDYLMRVIKNAERCETYWKTAPAHLRDLGDNFMRGVRAFSDEHPERIPSFAVELHGWQCMAVMRAMSIAWPLEDLAGELARKASAPSVGSNCFAVAPSRSAEGCAIFLADPHLTWEGMAVFTEARVHTNETNLCGFWLVGSPLPVMGHTSSVAWANTLAGPDTSDVYMVKLNPQNPLQYEYNGEWRDFQVEPITIQIKGQPPLQKPALYSVHGPLMEEPDPATGIGYCGATPYLDAMGCFDAIFRVSMARSCEDFYEALSTNELVQVNFMFTDTGGHLQYVRNGRVPIRPEGYNWSLPVPGSTADTRWLGIHDIRDLVQVKDPLPGYYVNCNNSPEFMFENSPMTPDKYKDYIYHATWDYRTPRSERLLSLIKADTSVTREEAMAYAVDVYDILAKPWQHALKQAAEVAGQDPTSHPDLADAVKQVLEWDGQFSRDSLAAPIVRFWRLKCEGRVSFEQIASGKLLDEKSQKALLDALGEALAEMKSLYGKPGITWGEMNVIGRGGRYFACPGGEFGNGGQLERTETLMDVDGAEQPKGSGKYVAYAGSSSMMLSFLRPEGIESYSLVNWGQSADEKSPHYLDQAEKLYVERKFKPTWFRKEELMKHLESERTFLVN